MFLGFMNCEIESNGELVFSIIIWVVAAFNFIVGYKEEKKDIPEGYWKRAEPSAGKATGE